MELTKVDNSGCWKPGQSGNLNGRPVGSRQAFSSGFLSDLAVVWQEYGRQTMIDTAKANPSVFFGTCAKLIPQDVKLTVERTLPGGLDPADWVLLNEVLSAVKEAMPDASSRPPGAVLEHVLTALRQVDAKLIEPPYTENPEN